MSNKRPVPSSPNSRDDADLKRISVMDKPSLVSFLPQNRFSRFASLETEPTKEDLFGILILAHPEEGQHFTEHKFQYTPKDLRGDTLFVTVQRGPETAVEALKPDFVVILPSYTNTSDAEKAVRPFIKTTLIGNYFVGVRNQLEVF